MIIYNQYITFSSFFLVFIFSSVEERVWTSQRRDAFAIAPFPTHRHGDGNGDGHVGRLGHGTAHTKGYRVGLEGGHGTGSWAWGGRG